MKSQRSAVGHDVTDVAENLLQAQDLLSADALFGHLVVPRSRAYASNSQMLPCTNTSAMAR